MLRHAALTIAAVLALGGTASAADPLRSEQWGLSMVEGPAAWSTSTGVGAVVAVIDTGVQSEHPDLAGRLLQGYDFVGNDPDKSGDEDNDPEDGEGHGTHVTGIVVATRDNGEGITGVAPGARVLPLRVLADDGGGYVSDVVAGVDRAVAEKVHVINLSVGDFIPFQSALFGDEDFENALRRAVQAGITVVLAAGNNSLPVCENPELEGTLCVGSVDRRRSRSVFSSFGDGVDLMGPGGSALGGSAEDVLSTYPRSRYESLAGTSMAAPHVAGVAALLASVGVTGRAAADRIVATAADAGPPGGDDQYGAGIVNARAAVAGLSTPPPSTGDPTAPRGSFSTKRRVRVRAVRKRGFRVRCRAVRPGRCAVTVRYRGRKIAGGRKAVPAEVGTRVVARLNKRGRKVVSRARIKKRIRVRMQVRLPGESVRSKRIVVRR